MITTIILLSAALLLLLLLWYAVRRQGPPIRSLEELAAALQLRENLSAADFHHVQRQRLRSAAEYVARTAHNAALWLRVGQSARGNEKPEIARAAAELVEQALHLRLQSLFVLTLLYVRIAAPGLNIRVSHILQIYRHSRERLLNLSRLQAPAQAARLESLL